MLDPSNTKITVLCTVYNGEKYFDRAIPSILAQTYRDFEFLIIEDGSSDNTLTKLKQIAKEDPRIKILTPGRLGRVKALNYGIEQASGDLIAIQDFDDISYPDRLEKQVLFFSQNKEIAWLGTASVGINEMRNERRVNNYPTQHEKIIRSMAHSIPYDHTLVTFRKKCVLSVGGYSDNLGGVEDFLLSINLAAAGYKFANLSDVLGEHIEHITSYWNSNFTKNERQNKIKKAQIYAIKKLNLPKWMYIYPFARNFYSYLPTSLKTILRKLVS